VVTVILGLWSGGGIAQEESGKFVKLSRGYHSQALGSYKENMEWVKEMERGRDPQFDMEKVSSDSIETKVSVGYRRGNVALIADFGHFGEVRTNWRWGRGSTGWAGFDTYFASLTLRRYLFPSVFDHPKGLALYGQGGGGIYIARWQWNDDNSPWYITMGTGEPVRVGVLKAETGDLGWHLGGGIEWFFTPHFSLDIEGLYRWVYLENNWRYHAHMSPQDTYYGRGFLWFRSPDRELELDLSGLSASLGANLFF